MFHFSTSESLMFGSFDVFCFLESCSVVKSSAVYLAVCFLVWIIQTTNSRRSGSFCSRDQISIHLFWVRFDFELRFDLVMKEETMESVFGTEQRSFCVEKLIHLLSCFSFGFESSKRQTALSDVPLFNIRKFDVRFFWCFLFFGVLFCCEIIRCLFGCLFFGLNHPNDKQPKEWIILQQRSDFDSFVLGTFWFWASFWFGDEGRDDGKRFWNRTKKFLCWKVNPFAELFFVWFRIIQTTNGSERCSTFQHQKVWCSVLLMFSVFWSLVLLWNHPLSIWLFVFWFESSKRQTAEGVDHFAAEIRFRFICFGYVLILSFVLIWWWRKRRWKAFLEPNKEVFVLKIGIPLSCFSFVFESSKRQAALSDVPLFNIRKFVFGSFDFFLFLESCSVVKCLLLSDVCFLVWINQTTNSRWSGSFCSRDQISILCLNTFRVCEMFWFVA